MKYLKYILVGLVLLLTGFLLNRISENIQIDEKEKEFSDLSVKFENAVEILSNYHRISRFSLVDTCIISDVNYVQKRVKDNIHKETLALWFDESSCSSCYSEELKLLKQIFNESNRFNVMIFVSGLKEKRAFLYLCQELEMNNSIFFIETRFFADDFLNNSKVPFVFRIDTSLNIKNLILLEKTLPPSLSHESILLLKQMIELSQ